MPLETILVTVEIGTHTDSLPLNGPKLAMAIAKAIEEGYRNGEHDHCEIIECESVKVDGTEWLPSLMCRNDHHALCRERGVTDCACICHAVVVDGTEPA